MDKFNKVKNDKDTAIIFESIVKVDEFDVLYQKWVWFPYHAESLIFVTEEVNHFTKKELIEFVRELPVVLDKEDPITVKYSEDGYTFVTFNVEEMD